MIPHIRKLLNATDNDFSSSTDHQELNITSSSLSLHRRHRDDASVRRPTAPFDSSMALTILVLLTALFFMGFFSIYIRRFADDSPVESSRSRRRRLHSSRHISDSRHSTARKGADPVMVQSLPVISYRGKDTKHLNTDCPICLGEFEEAESVKMIPHCAHVFHPGCIDTWLSCRATCPLCRTSRLFPVEEESLVVDINAITKGSASGSGNSQGRLETTVGDDDTWTSNVRRINSCSSLLGERPTSLQRTLSF